ncbi:hypothetical protein ACP70R_016122 [Stipagrostis hirtigluma subsp. patula]
MLKLNCSETTNPAVGGFLSSDDIYAGGHRWRIRCYPCGCPHEHSIGDCVALFVELRSKSAKGVKAIFEAFVLDPGGAPSRYREHALRSMQVYPPEYVADRGCHRFDKPRSDLRPLCSEDGCVTLVCGIVVLAGAGDDAIPVPPSDVRDHLRGLLDSAVGADVSFVVGGETFPAHRALLAARSPVFRAELFGSTADATSPSITLNDVEPAAFRIMLGFMYTDELPGDDEVGEYPIAVEMARHLLAAADRYALDRLKLICAQKLWEDVAVDTVASTLVFAETYSCPELKNRCMDFFAAQKNLTEIIFTEGFLWLVQKFPALAAEMKERVRMSQA